MAYRGLFKTSMAVIAAFLGPVGVLFGAAGPAARVAYDDVVEVEAWVQYEVVRPAAETAIALRFKVKDTWHFYADAATAPGGMNLKIRPEAEGVTFGEPIFPPSEAYFDESSGKQVQAFSGEFTVYQPFTVDAYAADSVEVVIGLDGAVCSESLCMRPRFERLLVDVAVSPAAPMMRPAFELPQKAGFSGAGGGSGVGGSGGMGVWVALALAAGLVLNLMPCVWPVLPIVIMRFFEQSGHIGGRLRGAGGRLLEDKAGPNRGRSFVVGAAFCGGILLFFAVLAGGNIILRTIFGTIFQWGDHFRNPFFLVAMSILMVVLAMFMFGVLNIGIPSSIAGRGQGGRGIGGSVGMGFLAAVLATPCSFAILTAAFAWAQTQPLAMSTAAIMLIGVGMAAPYLILAAVPGLIARLPRPGRWMEVLKQGLGFLLLVIAIKMLSGLPGAMMVSTLYWAAAVAFAVWMWGGWVGYATAPAKKWLVRSAAAGLAVGAGFLLFGPEEAGIDWQEYDAAAVAAAVEEGRPVVLKFTADWCASCTVVEKTVYGRRDVAALLNEKGALMVKADTTLHDYPATIDLQHVYNEPAVPVTIMLMPGEDEPVRLPGVRIRRGLTEALERLPGDSSMEIDRGQYGGR